MFISKSTHLSLFTCFVGAVSIGSVLAQDDQIRNFKKGAAFHTAQSCSVLDQHLFSSWWYTWGTDGGFADSFCDEPENAASEARAKGMDYVPMFWGDVPSAPFDAATSTSLVEATYLMTFNEPDREDQANMTPLEAAQLWPSIEAIAASYDLEIVAPCTTHGGSGVRWYEDFLEHCASINGECQFDYTCTHLYYHAYPCPQGVSTWSCIGENGSEAKRTINKWFNKFGGGTKPVWITEYACAPWEAPCFPADHEALMDQLTPILQNSDKVFRYAWFSAYQFDDWTGNALNELVWDKEKGAKCPDTKWIGGFGNAGWQMKSKLECVQKAAADESCFIEDGNLVLSMDNKSCLCSTDACDITEPSFDSMKTYRLVGTPGSGVLSSIGVHYDETFNPDAPTVAPTPSPTPSPTAPFKWSRERGVECSNKFWVTGFGNNAWQAKTETECVARARAESTKCAQDPLVLSMDDTSCFCATDGCETTVQSHPFMETHRPIALVSSSLDSDACGMQPNGWKCTNHTQCQSCTCKSNGKCGTTAAPTYAPTPQPTPIPTAVPTEFPTSEPTSVPTEEPTLSPTAPFGWSRERGVECSNTFWVTGFGNNAWQAKTEMECVAMARDEQTKCSQDPLVLSMDDSNCFCATDACETTIESHPWMATHRKIALTSVGSGVTMCGVQPLGWKCTNHTQCQSCTCKSNGNCGNPN